MTNPKDTKFPHIPVSPLQGLVNYCEAQTKLHVIGRSLDSISERIEQKKQKAKKSLLDLCSILNYTFDTEIGLCKIYYRVADGCESPQSDIDMDCYTIEAVMKYGKHVKYTGRDEQNILIYLNETNPLGVVYKTRAQL